MLRTILMALITLLGVSAFAAEKPQWTNGEYRDLPNSYIKTVYGTGFNVDQARDAALQQLMGDRAIEAGQRINVTIAPDGTVVSSGSGSLTVKARVLDQYVEYMPNGNYRVYILAQVAKYPTYDFEGVRISTHYPFTGDALIPGMAQIRKGSMGKATVMITGEIVGVGGIVLGECMRKSYKSKIRNSHDIHAIKSYQDKAKTYENVRNIAIAGTAAIYLWSLIDGIVAPGKKHIEVSRNTWTYSPWLTPESTGISLTYNF